MASVEHVSRWQYLELPRRLDAPNRMTRSRPLSNIIELGSLLGRHSIHYLILVVPVGAHLLEWHVVAACGTLIQIRLMDALVQVFDFNNDRG